MHPKNEAEAVAKFRPFVIKVARYFKSTNSFSEEDLIQEGLIAVALAFRQWRPETGGASFLSWIRKPVYYAMLKQLRQHKRRGGSFSRGGGPNALKDDMATEGVRMTSMDEPIDADDHAADREQTLHDRIGTFDEPPDVLALERLPDLVALLEPQERKVIRMRYEDGLTRAEVADALSYSREHIRKVEIAALEKLKAGFAKDDEC